MYERQLLRELETLRPDVSNSNAKVDPKPNGIPKPTIIPPLEDDFKPLVPPTVPNPSQNRGPVKAPSIPPSSGQAHVPPQSPGAGSSKSPLAAPQRSRPPLPPLTSTRETTRPHVPSTEPPLGGRFADGTKSMFIQPSSSSSLASSAQAGSARSPTVVSRPANIDPLLGGPFKSTDSIQRPGSTDGVSRGANDVDPLGGIRPAFMSASVRVQPTRRR